MIVKSIKCDVSGDDYGNFDYDTVTLIFDDSSELVL